MASFLSTTATLSHTTPLPAGTTTAQALAMLSDRAFFLSCDPHMSAYEPIPPSSLTPPPTLPDTVRSHVRPRPSDASPAGSSSAAEGEDGGGKDEEGEEEPLAQECYRVTDIVHAIPAGIWDTKVVSTYEFTDIEDGLFVRIRSPMSVTMETFWRVREAGGGGEVEGSGSGGEKGLELVEEVTMRCSRLLVGIVKGQCEAEWVKIHAKMVGRLEEGLK
ncbi:hypothetical protein C8A05DRAFT_31593 [Staphylotrichum tortipilum]|uniref:DUF7053 domain-containing protein n=1 Tax=Staphylotrichum tortipilum TaxID=2831512 RepID=A0AAN6MQJ3_9PEZI|nr:hypothetical protein C8A05DRAFT_31593 [Staphylotrichum longicolle]